LGLEGCIVGTL
jgi:hypothetical protein